MFGLQSITGYAVTSLSLGRRVDAKRAALFIIIVSGLIFGALIAVRRPIFFNKPGPSKSPRRLTNNTGSNRTYSGDESILQLDSGYPFQPEWLESNLHGSKKYGIVIDAGSSGTRLMVYSWLVSELMDDNFPTVEAASSESGPWRKSVEPGLSSLTTDPSAANVAKYLSPLLDFAEAMIPKGQQADTPIYLFATAGMRLVPEVTRSQLMRHACDIVSRSYSFSIQAGCERQFRVISGESEGLFGWITVNYLLPDGFKRRLNPIESVGTYGFLELGGGSAQVAIEASHQITASKPDYSKSLVLRTVGGQEFVYTVDVTSFLGFGMNEARRVYLESLFAKYSETRIKGGKSLDKPILKRNWPGLPVEATHPPRPHTHPLAEGTISQRDLSSADGSTIEDPCLPRGLEMPESISVGQITLIGTGSIDDCREQLRQNVLLISRASNSSCSKDDPVCLLPRVRAALRTPKLSQNTLVKLIGTSEFFYTPEGVFGLGGSYSYSEMYSASSRYCSTAWNDILQLYQSSMDDDGLLRRADAVTVTRKRLRKQCFRAAWVMTLLHDGFGIPKDGPDALDSVALPARSGKLLARRELDLDKDGDGSGAEGWSTLSREVRSRRKVRRSLSKGSRNVAARVEEFRSQAFSGDISDFVQGPVSLTSAIEIEGTPISWTLGVMLLHVASTIPPLERLPENSESPTVSGTPGAIFGENRGDDSSNGRFLAEAVISWTALLVLVIVVLSAVGVTCRSIHRRRRGSKGSLTVLPLLNTQVQFGAQSQSSPSGGNPSLENVNFSGGRSSLNPLLLNGRASSDQGSSPRDSPLLTPLGRDEGLPPPTGASSAWRRSAGGSMDIDLESYIGEDAGLVMSSRYETGLSAQHGGLVPSASSAGPLNESASSSSGSLTSWFSSRRTKRSY
ncbi:nucleoside phosphatase family-domain-containing protein [Zopfochytrium polystomum]|nr:nucleoside phosphatase family-domain-containing protein [Zopfochytrium polystomum]